MLGCNLDPSFAKDLGEITILGVSDVEVSLLTQGGLRLTKLRPRRAARATE